MRLLPGATITDIDDIVQRLAEVQDELIALPDGASAERYQLLQKRDALREEAAKYAGDFDSERSDDDLVREMRALHSALDAGFKQRIDLVGQAGSDQQSALGGVALNAALSEAQGTNAVAARIARIRGILTDRGIDIPD